MTFHDEMIDLLKEKLDNPDDYTMVADTQGTATSATNQERLYQDPEATQKKSSHNNPDA